MFSMKKGCKCLRAYSQAPAEKGKTPFLDPTWAGAHGPFLHDTLTDRVCTGTHRRIHWRTSKPVEALALWDQHRNAKHPRLLCSKSLPVKKWHKILHTSNAQCCKLLVHKNCSQMCPSTGSAHHESFFKAVHILMNANMFANIMKIVFPTEHCEVIWIKYVPLDMSVCRWSRSDLCFICGLGAAAECGHVLYENWLWKALTRCHLSRLPLVLNLCIWIWEAETLAEQKSHGKVSWGDEIQYQNFNYFIIVGQRLTQKEDHNGNGCITGPQHAGKWWHFNHHGATNPRGGSALVS